MEEEQRKLLTAWKGAAIASLAILLILVVFLYLNRDKYSFDPESQIKEIEEENRVLDSLINASTYKLDSLKKEENKVLKSFTKKTKTIEDEISKIRTDLEVNNSMSPSDDIKSREANLARILRDRSVSSKID